MGLYLGHLHSRFQNSGAARGVVRNTRPVEGRIKVRANRHHAAILLAWQFREHIILRHLDRKTVSNQGFSVLLSQVQGMF